MNAVLFHLLLYAEHKITRLAQLVDVMASRLGVHEQEKPELGDIKLEVAPVAVLRTIDEEEEKHGNGDD